MATRTLPIRELTKDRAWCPAPFRIRNDILRCVKKRGHEGGHEWATKRPKQPRD